MSHLLDNMIWNGITTGNRSIAEVNGTVGAYHADIAPFAAIKEFNQENFEKLYQFLSPGRKVAVSYFNFLSLDESKWQKLAQMECYQMVYENPIDCFTTLQTELVVPLTREHVPQMLELTALTKPGPFFENTILFGNYFGIFKDGKLAAMTGQRMNPGQYMEVSAVCTHPDFRGLNYARTLMLHVMKIILDNSFTPFLHVLTSNSGAIKLYESIGFTIRKKIMIGMVKRMAD
ncbi:MAG TPA: GNAT family N-acetyltransferase [Chitinophagaceae bacterium]